MGNKRHEHAAGRSGGLGKVLLISSGETSASAHDMFEHVFSDLRVPVRLAILETPAGFELNSAMVAGKIGDYLRVTMRNFSPSVSIVPARRSDGPFSTNDPALLSPLLDADCLYLGAGSPTYTVRHLANSLAWEYLVGRHRRGAAVCLASAASIAFSTRSLPVYEIYKAGQDLYWADGLDFFGQFGLDLAIVTHWDNQDGGAVLDTSRCFMGRARMEKLRRLLPDSTLVLGIDEHTGVILDFENEICHVAGKGGMTIQGRGSFEMFESGATFPIQKLGPYHRPPAVPELGPAVEVSSSVEEVASPPEILELVERRESERRARNWAVADDIRRQVARMGFEIQDTPDGPRLHAKKGEPEK